jgi:hypothetical protein
MRAEKPCTGQAQKLSTDITLGRTVRLQSYRVQLKKDAKSFAIAGAD